MIRKRMSFPRCIQGMVLLVSSLSKVWSNYMERIGLCSFLHLVTSKDRSSTALAGGKVAKQKTFTSGYQVENACIAARKNFERAGD